MLKWQPITLAEVAEEVTVGHVGPMARHYQEAGIPFLRSLNVTPHALDLADVKYISSEFNAKLEKSALRPGDVVTVRTGKPGTTSVIPVDLTEANCSDLVITRPGPGLDARWFSYYMNSVATSFIDSQLVGAVQQHFNVGSAKSMKILLPSLSEQQAIAEVLGAFDDKIAANSRLAHTANELQRTKFHSLLADAVQMPLSETAQFVNGKAFTKNASGFGRMVVRIAELNSSPGASTVYNDLDVEDKHIARPGDILFAWSGSLTLHRWYRGEAIVNQHIFKVIPNPDYPPWLVFELIRHKLAEFRAVAADKATTMGHIQRRHLDEPVLVPLQSAVASYDSLMAELWDCALKANEENLTLASLRDALLPQLMSGKLRVKDAEKVVEGAL